MLLRLSPQLGQAVVTMQIDAGAGFAAAANGTGPAGRRPGQHLLQTARPVLAVAPERRRRGGERGRRRAADDLVAEERRRELGG